MKKLVRSLEDFEARIRAIAQNLEGQKWPEGVPQSAVRNAITYLMMGAGSILIVKRGLKGLEKAAEEAEKPTEEEESGEDHSLEVQESEDHETGGEAPVQGAEVEASEGD